MPLKYYCPKCLKRYVDWGAEKLEFKCPDCEGETLYRVGTLPEGADKVPSLSKRPAKKKAKAKAKPKAKAAAKPKKESKTAPDSDVNTDAELDGNADDTNTLQESITADSD